MKDKRPKQREMLKVIRIQSFRVLEHNFRAGNEDEEMQKKRDVQ